MGKDKGSDSQHYMDIPYSLDPGIQLDPCQFHTIWKVHANAAYDAVQPDGFASPGLFVTFGGQGVYTCGAERVEFGAGTYLLAEAGRPCAYKGIAGDWRFYFIAFSDLGMARQLELPIGLPVSFAHVSEAVRLCEQLINHLILKPAGFAYAANITLQELLLLFARERAEGGSRRDPELDAILSEMHRNIGEPFRTEAYIRQSGMSRTAFYARFRDLTGETPTQYMLRLKLASAKASLETTSLSVKEIAAALHFYDEFHFSKMFKRRYGTSPRNLRRPH